MLIRILADNPGPTFTRNIDKKFTDTVKDVLRNGRDPSVQQILRETIRALYSDKAYDQNLATLFQMWQKEPGGMQQRGPSSGVPVSGRTSGPGWEQYQPGLLQDGGGSRSRKGSRVLPPAPELAARVEEAKTSGKLLLQLIQSSTPEEILGNELIKEFAERCQSAQRSLQGYIACDSPAPDDATMQTLVDTCEQLSLAISKHQRAIMAARKATVPLGSSEFSSTSLDAVPGSGQQRGYSPPSTQGYSGPPDISSVPAPPASLQTGLSLRPASPHGAPPLAASQLPPTQQYSQQPRSNGTHEDPFSDDYAPDDENSVVSPYQTYQPPLGPPPSLRPGGPQQHLEQGMQRMGLEDRDREASFTGQPNSYHPGYQSTPSYMNRQESAQNHMTMHGAVAQDGVDGEVSPIVERSPRKPNAQFRF